MRTVKPSFANLALWRSIYRIGDTFYVDAIRTGYWGKSSVIAGNSTEALDVEDLLQGVPESSALYRDLERFDHFSDRYLSWHPDEKDILCDLRYAFLPNSLYPLWGIKLVYDSPDTHSEFLNFRDLTEERRRRFSEMLWNRGKSEAD